MEQPRQDRLRRAARELALHIAIDGPAGSGKSTIGRELARMLDCTYLDTGLMYRAVTWLAQRAGTLPTDAGALAEFACATSFDTMPPPSDSILVNGLAMGQALRTPQIDADVSAVSAHPAVRKILVQRQRELAHNRCMVMVGRDIGTVVLPGAPVKLWITASSDERARRRLAEKLEPGHITVDKVRAEIEARDRFDSHRPTSPLVRAADAITIDTDTLSEEDVLDRAARVVEGKILSP